jgi:hypothetical protein
MIILGVAALAVIAVIAVVVLVSQGGKSKPAAKPASNANPAANTNAPNANPAAVPNSTKLDSFLLGPPEVGAVVADPNMVVSDKTDGVRNPRWTLSNPACVGAYEPITEAAYKGTGYVAVAGQAVHTTGEDPTHRIFESAVAFPSADKAGAFVQASADQWKACAGQSVTLTANGKNSAWKFAEVTGAVPKIALGRTQTDTGRACHHALHASSNVVVDVLVCGPDAETGQAGRIAEQISARIGQ